MIWATILAMCGIEGGTQSDPNQHVPPYYFSCTLSFSSCMRL